ncbi:cytochrome c oxidase assembly factor 3 homolog, mitochondrial isoform 1-T1 [Sylvia borin]
MWRHAAARRRRGKMAAPGKPGEPGEAAFARRIDPAREPGLSPEQRRLMEQVEFAQRQRVLQRRLRSRNVLLALGIGAVTLGICILRGRDRSGSWTTWSRRRRRRGRGPGREPRAPRAERGAPGPARD